MGDRREPTNPFDSASPAASPLLRLKKKKKRDQSRGEGQMESRNQYILEAAALERPTSEFTASVGC